MEFVHVRCTSIYARSSVAQVHLHAVTLLSALQCGYHCSVDKHTTNWTVFIFYKQNSKNQCLFICRPRRSWANFVWPRLCVRCSCDVIVLLLF